MSLPKVSVIIPTYNGWDTLRPCLKSLFEQSLRPWEVLVVDNGSTDGMRFKVMKHFPKIRLLVLKNNTGVTGGRNAGIKHAGKESDYLLFFDHDMVAGRNMLKNLLSVAESDDLCGIVTPKIYYWTDRKLIWAAGTNINPWTGQVLFRGGKDVGQYQTIEEVQVAPAAMFVKKVVLKFVTEFDDKYFVTYEDTDFCFRARKYGFRIIYAPTAAAFHIISPRRSDDRKRLLRRSYWVGRNRVLFMKDFGRNFYFFLLVTPVYLLYFIKLAVAENDLRGLRNYIKGTIAGVKESL